jgi:hypothetical protein
MSSPLVTDDSSKDNESTLLERHSSIFPPGYGEFTFKSCDNVIFHFPRFLLSHSSPIFRDMYEVADSGGEDVLKLAEDCETLEYLLRHIDPAQKRPDLDWQVISRVLSAADKYQIQNVIPWFEKEVALEVAKASPPTIQEPLLCFELATHYGLPSTARIALRQLTISSTQEIEKNKTAGDHLIKKILILRAERIQWLTDVILQLGNEYTSNNCKLYFHKMPFLTWARAVIQAIAVEPSSRVVFSPIVKVGSCSCQWPYLSPDWKEKILAKERELPRLE